MTDVLSSNARQGFHYGGVAPYGYVATSKPDPKGTVDHKGEGTLTGWVTIRNNAGSNFDVDQLRLVAGEINRQQPQPQAGQRRFAMAESVAANSNKMTPGHSASDQHVYDYPYAVSLRKNDVTQLRLITAPDIEITKQYKVISRVQRHASEGVPGSA